MHQRPTIPAHRARYGRRVHGRSRLLAAVALLALTACGGSSDAPQPAIRVTDGGGRTVALAEPADRVVSLMPSMTEWVIAMGAAHRLVARTEFDDHPAVQSLPSVGGGLTPSVEWLAAREPDLVVSWTDAPSRSLVARLEALGVAVYTAPSETVDEALDAAADVGRLLGLAEAADSVIAETRAGLEAVRRSVGDRERPDVLFLIGLDPLMAAGPGTFVDELVTVAGGRNILEGTGLRWPQLSLEEVVTRAPDVVIVASASVTDPGPQLAGRPGWRDVPAVRAGRVHAVDPDRINRPGPGLDESAATLARLIRGDAE